MAGKRDDLAQFRAAMTVAQMDETDVFKLAGSVDDDDRSDGIWVETRYFVSNAKIEEYLTDEAACAADDERDRRRDEGSER